MLATFSEAKQSGLEAIAQACPNSREFLRLVNEATRRLMRRGDWVGTLIPIHVCVRNGCVVWNRYVGQVRKVNVCKAKVPVRNLWGDFLDVGGGCGWQSWIGAGCRMTGLGTSPIFQDIMGEGRLVRAYPRCRADVGKVIRIFGTDNNGQTMMTHDTSTDTWSEGVPLILNLPFVSTPSYVRHIDRVLKDLTQCPVDVYGYDVANDVLEDCSHYEPSETNPEYEKDQLFIGCGRNTTGSPQVGNCGNLQSVVALVKLRFIPVRHDTDLVLVQNLDALKDFIQSIRYREAGDAKAASEYEAAAIRELNLELFERDQFDIQAESESLGGTSIGMQKVF